MTITLQGTETNYTIVFMDEDEFIYNYGRQNYLFNDCYSCIVNEDLVVALNSTTGLNTNATGTSLTDKGVGERGSAFRGNSLDSRVLGLYFKGCNVITSTSKIPNKTIDQILIDMVETGNEELEVTVDLGDYKYATYFAFNVQNTDVGSGYLELFTSRTNQGMDWAVVGTPMNSNVHFRQIGSNVVTTRMYLYEEDPAIPMKIPFDMSNTYPRSEVISFSTETYVDLQFGGEIHGRWRKIDFTFGENYHIIVTNIHNDTIINIDSRNNIVTNQDGIERTDVVQVVTGEQVRLVANGGEFEALAICDFPKAFYTQPTDIYVSLTYADFVNSLPEGAITC